MSDLLETETREIAGRRYQVKTYFDSDMGAPWREHDGHGPVTDWESRNKAPAELILSESRGGSKRFYDFGEAVKIAKRDGWSASVADFESYQAGDLSNGQRAARAARADFERLRAWCNDSWHWIGIQVAPLCDCGEAVEDKAESLWGIESDCGDYFDSVVSELAAQIDPLALVTLSDHVDAAASLWESVLETRATDSGPLVDSINDSFAEHGVAAMRQAIAEMSGAVHIAWQAAQSAGFDSPFDWEFCPAFVARCIDWQGVPTLHPDYMTTARAIGKESS